MKTEQVIEFYRNCASIKETARYFAVSEQKIRRLLITAGEYENEQSRLVTKLYNVGVTPEKIGKHLGLSKSAVFADLPYIKGPYMADVPSDNAIKIRRCREKKGEKDVKSIQALWSGCSVSGSRGSDF